MIKTNCSGKKKIWCVTGAGRIQQFSSQSNESFVRFFALLEFDSRATVVTQTSVVRPSVNSGFLEAVAWMHAKFYGKVSIWQISRLFSFSLNIFNFQTFTIFFPFHQHGTLWELNFPFHPNFMINILVMGGYHLPVLTLLVICQKLKIMWHFGNQPMGVKGKILKCAMHILKTGPV